MRKLLVASILSLLFLPVASFGQSAEEDAIRAVIEGETRAFFDRDYARWAQHWVDHEAAFQAWSNRDGTFSASDGWEDVSERIRSYIESNPEPSHPLVIRKNFKYRLYGDAAYVIFDQYNSNRDGTRMTLSKEVRVMEKQDGQWKIAAVAALWDYTYPYTVDEVRSIE